MARSKTTWLPGICPNPGGRPAGLADVRELARSHTAEAITTLKEIMSDQEALESARIAAATALLDRGWGKPKQDMSIINVEDPVDEWTTAELINVLRQFQQPEQSIGTLERMEVIDDSK